MPDFDFWLNGDPTDVRLHLVEITHPSFSKPWRIVQNWADGITVQHEDELFYDYEYVPMTIEKGASSDNLDQSLTIGVGDLGEDFPKELKALRAGEYSKIRPTVNYREYNLSDLTKVQVSALGLELAENNPKPEGAVFTCRAKQMNLTATGESYNTRDYPTMKGF